MASREGDREAVAAPRPLAARAVRAASIAVALAMSTYQIVAAGTVRPPPFVHYPLTVGFALVVLFGFGLAARLEAPLVLRRVLAVLWDVALIAVVVAATLYLALNDDYVMNRFIWFEPLLPIEIFLSSGLILALLEAARRTVGWVLVIVVLVFIGYVFAGPYLPDPFWHRGQGISRILEQAYLSPDGLWNAPVKVTADYVFLFVLLGALLVASGAGTFFTEVAGALTGRATGGPAKTAIVASSFMGTLQGSSAGNVVTTGPFTIPAMRKAGYPGPFAAGVEAVASTGGQLTPPIMGAAAFLMVEFVGIPYSEVITIAILPALLYYIAVYATVDFEARRRGLTPQPDDDLPRLWPVVRARGYLLLPLVAMVWLLFEGYTPTKAGFWSIVILTGLIVVLDGNNRTRIHRVAFKAMTDAPRMIAPILVACAMGGLIAGIIVMTGLGLRLSGIIIDFSGGYLLAGLVLTMVVAVVLGMGMPTSAAYIILAALLAQGLVEMGTSVVAAHLFIIYCASKSAITPPVAVASYAAAAVAGTDPWRTSLVAFRLGLSVFIIPYMFVYGPELLAQGSVPAVAYAFTSAAVGVVALSAASVGWLVVPLKWYQTGLALAAAFAMIFVGWRTDLVGYALLGLLALTIWRGRRQSSLAPRAGAP